MDKGIRQFARIQFGQLSVQRLALGFGPIDRPLAAGNTEFRRAVMNSLQEAFGLTVLQAAPHYNAVFKEFRQSQPELVQGLGRPEDKKGGRRRREQTVEPAVVALLPAVIEPVEPMPDAFIVRRASTGEVVAEVTDIVEANTMVARASSQKRARLYWTY